MSSAVPPPINRDHYPDFHRLDWQKWERLTVAVLECEPAIATSDLYGLSRQPQYGIDVLARRVDDDGEEVASCKLRKTITAKELAGWSDDFLKHWDNHWHEWNVRRFILATTATNTADRKIQDQIKAEQARFAAKGIHYELWAPAQFTAKLRTQRVIVANFLLDGWVEIICGPAVNQIPEQTGESNLLSQAAVSQLSELQRALSGQVAKRAEEAQEALRVGNRVKVQELIDELRAPAMWSQLPPETQAKLIRLQAMMSLHEDDFEEASRLAVESRQLEPEGERRIEAQIALRTAGSDAALRELGQPSTIAGRQLRATLLLIAGSDDEVEIALDELHREPEVDAETWRLTALHRSTRGQHQAALEAVQKAEALAPTWIAVRQAGVIVRYAQALSPAVGREWFFYPNPIDAALVVEEAAAQAVLGEALPIVEAMERADASRNDAALWKLAVLSNLKGRREEASEQARHMLSRDPAEPTAIAWCVNRQLDVELDPSLEQLKSDYTAGCSAMAARILGVLLINMAPEDGAEFLAGRLDAQQPDTRDEAERWIARLRGTPADDEESALPNALHGGREQGDWREALELTRARLDEVPPHIEGLTLAQALAEAQQWPALLEFTDRLPLYETATAIRLTAYTLFNNMHFQEVLSLLEAHGHRFGSAIPEDLRHIRAEAFLRIGQPQQSLRELEQIGAQSLDLKLLGAEARVSLGDVRGSVPIIREAFHANSLTGAHALHWSRLLLAEEPELARALWQRAKLDEASEELAVPLMEHGFRLGLDSELAPVMRVVQVRALSKSPDARALSLDEVRELIERRRAETAQVLEQYQNGAVPAHLVAQNDEAAYLRLLVEESDPTDPRLRPRLIRNGMRPAELKIDCQWRDLVIHLDISGLVMAAQLDLLDLVEQVREPIRVSPQLPTILVRMVHGLQPAQPTELAAHRTVWTALVDGTVALNDRKAAPDTLAVLAQDDIPPPVDGLIRALESAGLLGGDDARKALASVANHENEPLNLEGVNVLQLDSLALLELARAELLPLLKERFRLECSSDVRQMVQQEMKRQAERDRLADFAKRLQQRVAENLLSGRFLMLSPASAPDGENEGSPLFCELKDILGASPAENGVAWFDDRMISSYPRTDSMPVVGVFEILQTLAADGRLSEDEYRKKVLTLRELGACFISFDSQEVLGALRNAPSDKDGIRETHELKALRRSFCVAGRLEANLQIIPPESRCPKDRPDEIEYPRSSMRLLSDCLSAIWTNPPIDVERAYAESDWLWQSFRQTQLNRPIPGDDTRSGQDGFQAMQIAHLLDKAFEIGGVQDERKSLREAYLHWVWERCIRRAAHADPTFLDGIGDYLAGLYRSLLDDARTAKKERDRRVLKKLALLHLVRLPDSISKCVIGTGKLGNVGGVSKLITLGKDAFDPISFWRTVRRVLRYGTARLRTADGRRVRVTRDGGSLVFRSLRLRLTDDLNGIIAARPHELERLIAQYLVTLDADPSTCPNRLKDALGVYAEPHRLAEVFHELRESSPARRYEIVAEKIAGRRPLDAGELLPASADRLIRHLALGDGAEGGLDLAAAASILAGQVGRSAAFERIGGIPVSLPATTFAAFDEHELFSLAMSSVTPVRLIQVLTEARRRGLDTERLGRITNRLIDCTENAGKLHLALLRWAEKAFRRDPSWIALSPSRQLALAWAHADRLAHHFIINHSAPGPLAEFLEENPPTEPVSGILRASKINRDQGSPGQLSPNAILYHGLGAAFGKADLTSFLPEPCIERLAGLLRSSITDMPAPDIALLYRHKDDPDAMGSFLRETPVGILDDSLDPEETRDALINAALQNLEAGERDVEESWNLLGALAMAGLDEAQSERLRELLNSADIYALAFGFAFQPIRWRALLGSFVATDRDWVQMQLVELAAQCGRDREPRLVGDQARGGLDQLMELAAIVAAEDPDDPTQDLSNLFLRIALAWPASAPRLRAIVDDLLAVTRPREADALWQLRYHLGSMP